MIKAFMNFVKSSSIKISVLPSQEKQLSSKERIKSACNDNDVLAFDIFDGEVLIGFIMARQYAMNESRYPAKIKFEEGR